MFDYRKNQTTIERLGSIDFWRGFVRWTTLGIIEKQFTKGGEQLHSQNVIDMIYWLFFFINYIISNSPSLWRILGTSV